MNIQNKQWEYSSPEFECDKLNNDLLKFAPWSGHRNFAYDFTRWMEPENIVELGSHYGCSAFTFVQAAKDSKLSTDMFFIDTWQGDDFTKKYNNDVYTVFSETVSRFYDKQNVSMLRMTFDEANSRFEDKSVELLHIDGSHHYADVKHDFETWLPKVKDTGVIMLHDTSSDIVLGDIMGSHRYWQELKNKYKYTVEFDFSWGLGIIFLDKAVYDKFMSSGADLQKYQRTNNALDVEYKDQLRKNYFELKDDKFYIDDLLKQKEVLEKHIEAYKNDAEEIKKNYEDTINSTKSEYENTINKTKSEYENSIKNIKDEYESSIQNITADYENTIKNNAAESEKEKEAVIAAYEDSLKNVRQSYEETLEGKESYIRELEKIKQDYDIYAAQTEKKIGELEQIEQKYIRTMSYKLAALKKKLTKQV